MQLAARTCACFGARSLPSARSRSTRSCLCTPNLMMVRARTAQLTDGLEPVAVGHQDVVVDAEGDLPASIFHLQLISNDAADWNAKTEVIAVFHTNAGHVTLHDSAYNADRNIATGNPYKMLLADLMTRGVQVELCGATAKVHH